MKNSWNEWSTNPQSGSDQTGAMMEEHVEDLRTSSQTIHECVALIWQTLGLRARLFLLEGDSLVLRYCAGGYGFSAEGGTRILLDSLVWRAFEEGKAINFDESVDYSRWPYCLPEPVSFKAVIPLKCSDFFSCQGERRLGVLVVDAGDPFKPVDDRDFRHLTLVGMLLSEVLACNKRIERIRTIQQEKREAAGEVAHVFRNRFTVIGGFALRLTRALEDPALRRYARIILKETCKGEKALERWNKLNRG